MSAASVLVMLAGIAVVQLHRARRVIKQAEDFQARIRDRGPLLPFPMWDER